MGALKSLVIMTGCLTLMYGILFLTVTEYNFPLIERNARFEVNGSPVFDSALDDVPGIGAQRQFVQTSVIESLVVTLNIGMGLATIIAGITEVKILSFICGGWMLVFALVEVAVISSYENIRCPLPEAGADGEEPTVSPEDLANCASGQVDDIYVGSQVLFAAIVIYYVVMGVVTIMYARSCEGGVQKKSPTYNQQGVDMTGQDSKA